MCGIAGWVDYARRLVSERSILRAMAATAALRGPDAEGIWLDEHVGLGHRRLAVIDLPGGAQPMTVEHDGRTIAALTYSGEVYNYRELLDELRTRGHRFHTASDTEVVLHAYLEWGEDFPGRLNGMYAFGLWDARQERLLLVRDRMGIKPLCYAPTADGVLFGSEPKTILAHPSMPAVVDADGLRELLAFSKTPAALTDPLYRHAVLAGNDTAIGGDMYTSLYLLFRAVREHSTVALSGESADEVFGGYRWFHDPQVVGADTFPWIAAVARWTGGARGGGGPAGLLDPDLAATLDVATYRADTYRQALAEVDHLPGEDATEYRMREVCHLHLTRFVQILLDRKDRMSMANGLEVRVPFCDHRLVEYVYNTPWSMKTFDGREKSLLRAATADLLPPSVVQRRKSPYPSTQDPRYQRVLYQRLGEVLADPDSPALQLLDPGPVRDLLAAAKAADTTGAAPAAFGRMSAELVLGIDQWLRRYPVRLAV